MDDLEFIRMHIAEYADYTDEDSRHLVDKQVRAWVGEALAQLRERLRGLPDGLADRLDRVILLCGFTNQQFMHAMDHSHLEDIELSRLHEIDRSLIEAAAKAAAMTVDALDGYLASIEDQFSQRARAVRSAAA